MAEAPPSLAQTYARGPLAVNGSGQAMTKAELDAAKAELEEIKATSGLKEPERAHMDDEGIHWRFGGKPDYSLVNLLYLKGKTKNHAPGSLELVVENLVKTWEMERSHKLNLRQHQSVDPAFTFSTNGGKKFSSEQAHAVGNYNVLLSTCPAQLWDSDNTTWEQSHGKFHSAFAAFPWELLELFSKPPRVAFSWRHWGNFTGSYEGNSGKGELIEVYGFGIATVNDRLQLLDVEIFYRPENLIEVLRGERPATDLAQGRDILGPAVMGACPHAGARL
uniref:Pathogen-related protein n=1 Tax=Alexandrium monilatum TaxID=311494 RepID=A0A7S4QUJ2_9DINO|mmetsp:Transcript_30178/g.89492  ORF Transcript_30178/g.89492 Transcript_30178/m.89492 type:complete len:277 (+) Transcript_30178:131-961(+)